MQSHERGMANRRSQWWQQRRGWQQQWQCGARNLTGHSQAQTKLYSQEEMLPLQQERSQVVPLYWQEKERKVRTGRHCHRCKCYKNKAQVQSLRPSRSHWEWLLEETPTQIPKQEFLGSFRSIPWWRTLVCNIAVDDATYVMQDIDTASYCIPIIEDRQWDDLNLGWS